jgi:hypothetical protein
MNNIKYKQWWLTIHYKSLHKEYQFIWCWKSRSWLKTAHQMISKNIVVTKIVKFRSLLLILKQITSVFAIIINLFIWHFYSLPYYNIQFTIGRYASKIHMHICFEDNDNYFGHDNIFWDHLVKPLNLYCVFFLCGSLFAYLSNFFSSLCSFLFVNHSFCFTFFSLCYCVVFSVYE